MPSTKRRGSVRKRRAKPEPVGLQTDPAVEDFIRKLKPPLKQGVEAVRQVILGASPQIREGIKWKGPSFRTADYFATLNLRRDRIWLILHTGAKVKVSATKGLKIDDPAGLLKWLAKDRCLVTFANEKDVQAKRAALTAIVRNWVGHL